MAKALSSRARILPALPAVLGISALAWVAAACSQGEPAAGRESAEAVAVRVVRAAREDLRETVGALGTLKASEEVTIRPEISAILEAIHFEEGEAVEAGRLLFSLENDEIRHRLTARRAALKAAGAEEQNALRVLKRRRELLEQDTIARETFDEAQTRYETAAARRERLGSEIREIEAELADTEIRAPIDGVAGALWVDPGDYVESGDPLVTLVRTDVLEIDFTVPERHAGRLASGQAVEVRTAAYPQLVFEGTVFFVSPRIRESARDLLLKARIENPEDRLRPGGFARAELVIGVRRQAVTLPEEALVPTRSGYIVFVVEDRRARRREVEIGLRRPGTVEITRGLKAGETVIRSGHISVSDGDAVDVVEKEEEAAGRRS